MNARGLVWTGLVRKRSSVWGRQPELQPQAWRGNFTSTYCGQVCRKMPRHYRTSSANRESRDLEFSCCDTCPPCARGNELLPLVALARPAWRVALLGSQSLAVPTIIAARSGVGFHRSTQSPLEQQSIESGDALSIPVSSPFNFVHALRQNRLKGSPVLLTAYELLAVPVLILSVRNVRLNDL